MKRNFVITVAIALFALAISASAQKGPDYSGKWNLDVSKLSGQQAQMIKSEVVTITQSGNSFKISTHVERNAPADGAPGAGRGGFGGGAGGDQSFTLDGKEMSMDMPGPGGATVPVKMSGKWDGSKIVTTSSRTFTNQAGESMTSTTKTTYELGADGKTLTVTTERTGGRGPSSSSRVYTKG